MTKLIIVTIQWIKSRIWDTIDDWYINNLAKTNLCYFSFERYLRKCVTQIYRALYGDAMFVSFWGTQTWRLWSNRNICHWVLLLKRRIIALELRHIERNVSSGVSTVQLAKTKVITHLLTYATAFSEGLVGVNWRLTNGQNFNWQLNSLKSNWQPTFVEDLTDNWQKILLP